MNSNKSLIILLILLIAGLALFSTVASAVSPGVAFCLGVVVSGIILWQRPASSVMQENDEGDLAEGTTLYVGNLSYKANESDVKDLFEQHGHVNSVRLMKDKRTGKRRGFGFVEVSEDDADAMISALNESEYMQRTIKVRVANEPKHPSVAES